MNMKIYIEISSCAILLQIAFYWSRNTCHAAFIKSKDLTFALNDDNETKCFETYGCFPTDGPWTTMTRQINVSPQSPQQINPHFMFYSTKLFNETKIINLNYPDELKTISINGKTKVFIIAHGYLESGSMPWMREMGKNLLNLENKFGAIVILVDWGGGSHPPYVQAAANIRLVGAMTTHLIYLLYKQNNLSNLNQFHLIGHSLGAHLMGYAGFHLQHKFGLLVKRITGLDPAAPLFSDTLPIVRLDNSDAEYVDIIHTDVNVFIKGGLGIYQAIGHVDFYPNGGFNNPGCDMQLTEYIKNTNNSILSNMQEFLGCNHLRSYQYFTESIQSKCPFMAITCESFDKFKQVNCLHCAAENNVCIPMGFHSLQHYEQLKRNRRIDTSKSLQLYLMTGDRAPFCRVHYKITVRVAGHDESTLHGGEIGMLSLRLHGRNQKTTARIYFSEEPKYFEPGFEYSALVAGQEIRKLDFATVYWDYETNFLNPLTWRILSSPRIFLEYILIEQLESEGVFLRLCSYNNLPIMSNSENIFKTYYCRRNESVVS